MARARNIKPALFKNEVLGTADMALTVLFTGLWTLADREGRLEDRPLRIKAEIFPYREKLDINGYLTELEQLGFITRYIVDEVRIIQVLKFTTHQNPHKTEKASELPKKPILPPSQRDNVIAPLNNGSITEPAVLIPDSLNTDSLVLIPDSGFPRADSPRNEKKKRTHAKKSTFTLPDGIPPEDWRDLEDHRKAIKRPMTDRARKDMASNVIACAEHNATTTSQVIGYAIQKGWTGIGADWAIDSGKRPARQIATKETHQERGERMARERETRINGNQGQGVISEQ